MFFNFRGLLKALRLSLCERPFSLRRWLYIIVFTSLYLVFVAMVVVSRWLDHLFFPGFRKIDVDRPVFIIAPPRSGTSFLQKVLSLDEARFAHWKMYQTILPSVCFFRLFDAIAGLDGRLGGRMGRFLQWCEGKWFGGWDEMHRMRLDQPEEDQALFLYAFAAESIFMLFPFVDQLWEVGFPDALPTRDRRKLMAYYRSCLQRHAYAYGGGRIPLIKSTHASGSIRSIGEEFPDALFITLVRHPYESIPSHVSLFVPAWRAHSPDIVKDGPESRAYAGLAVAWYKHLFQFSSTVSSENYYSLDYRDLRTNPEAAVQGLYHHFGWTVSDDFRAQLDEVTFRQRTFTSKHKYSLEEFGLSEQWIWSELEPVMAAYGMPP